MISMMVERVDLKTSRILNKFTVENYSTEQTADTVSLVIKLRRISSPFWMSLFVPSVCLILAAEVSLFIDQKHFQALIVVSLTSNLVMFTLYTAIQEKLPEDSNFKLIDIWLLHGLIMPMIVFLVLAANELMMNTNPGQDLKKVSKSMIKVKSEIDDGKEDMQETPGNTFMRVCKLMIPGISTIFITVFFIICRE